MLNPYILNNRIEKSYDSVLLNNGYQKLQESDYDYYIKEIDRILSLESSTPVDKLNAIGSCTSTANEYIREAMSIIKDNNYDSDLINVFESMIINKLDNKVFKSFFNREAIESIKEKSEDLYNILDSNDIAIHIGENHYKLNNNKNTYPDYSTKDKVWSLCREISEYNISNTSKVIIALEELAYSRERNNLGTIKYDSDKVNIVYKPMVDAIEYFNFTESDIDYDTINEYLINRNTISINGTKDIALPNKLTRVDAEYRVDNFTSTDNITKVIDDVFKDRVGINIRFNKFISCLVAGYTKGILSSENLPIIVEYIKNKYDTLYETIADGVSNQMDNMNSALVYGINLCDHTIYNNQNMDSEYIHNFIKLKEAFKDLLEYIKDSIAIKYNTANEMAVCVMDESFDEIISNITNKVSNIFIGASDIFNKFKDKISSKIGLRKFKTHKAKNLITMTTGIDKQIRDRMTNYRKNGLRGVFGKLKPFTLKEDMEITDSVLSEMVTSEGNINISLGIYKMEASIDEDDISFFGEITSSINNTLDSGIVYYICSENTVEFIYRDLLTEVELTTEEVNMLESYLSEQDKEYINTIESYSNLNDITVESLIEGLSSIDGEMFNSLLEIFSLMGMDKDIVYEIHNGILESKEDVSDRRAFKEDTIDSLILYKENFMMNEDELLESYNILSLCLESDDKDKDAKIKNKEHNDNHHVDKNTNKSKHIDSPKDKEKKFKGISLNDIKLYAAGIKDKAKNLSSKEQQLSRNADTAFNMFANNLKKAMVSDRREAIIKGSVIPSFSKSIKIALGLAGLGLVTGGPAVPIITALGGFACSKNLTRKERALLLDDIVIEIQVLDKEISQAENSNNYKKLRELMKTKRELERQYARIQYNMRVGKDMIPSRSTD